MHFLMAMLFVDLSAEEIFERVRERYAALADGFFVEAEVRKGTGVMGTRMRFELSGAQAGCRQYDCKAVLDGEFESYASPEEVCEYWRRRHEWDCAPSGRTNLRRLYDDSLARVEVMDWSVVDRVEVSQKKGHWVLRYSYKADPEIRQTVWVREKDWVVTRIQRESRKEMVEVVFRKVELGTKPKLENFRFVPPKGARRMKFLRR